MPLFSSSNPIHFRSFSTTSRICSGRHFPHASPHDVFRLPLSASQGEIKTRYYELVRLHHPDAPSCRHLPPAERRARFQSISAAYEALTGRAPIQSRHDEYAAELARRKRYYYHRPRPTYRPQHQAHDEWNGWASELGFAPGGVWSKAAAWETSADDRLKDRVMLAVGLASLAIGMMPIFIWNPAELTRQRHVAASANLAEARRDALEFGDERRKEIRRRVRAMSTHEDDDDRYKSSTAS